MDEIASYQEGAHFYLKVAIEVCPLVASVHQLHHQSVELTCLIFHLKVAVEVCPLVAKPATHQVETVLVLTTWLRIIVVIMTVEMIAMEMLKL